MKPIVESLEKAKQLTADINDVLSDISIPFSDRNRLAGTLYDISIEHAESVIYLVEKDHIASALALIRPHFEAYIRASWIHYCANGVEIQYVLEKDKFKLNNAEMAKAVNETRAYPDTLSKVIKTNLKAMHSYTHGGMMQVSHRVMPGFIEPNFQKEEIDEVSRFISIISFLCIAGIVELAENRKTDGNLRRMLTDLKKWCFTKFQG